MDIETQTDLFERHSALPSALRRPVEPIMRSAEIEGHYRWIARRAWGQGPAILWIGHNPSDADARRDDPSMWRMMSFSCRWGFGSLSVVNLYPYIASKPVDLHKWRKSGSGRSWNESGSGVWPHDTSNWAAWLHNIDVVEAELEKVEPGHAIAMWGNEADPHDVGLFLASLHYEHWHCLGTNLNGSPRHVLTRGTGRIPDTAKPVPWTP